MNPSLTYRLILLGMFFALTAAPAWAQKAEADAALRYLRQNHQTLALTPQDVDNLVVVDQHVSAPTGTTHLYFQQQIDGIPVYNGIVNVAMARDGRVVHVGNRAVADVDKAARGRAPGLSAEDAVEAAARDLGLDVTEPLRTVFSRQAQQGPFEKMLLSTGGIASEPITAQLMYVPMERGDVRLAWMVGIYTLDGQHYWHMGIDAATGAVLVKDDLVDQDVWDLRASPFSAEPGPANLAPLAEGWSSPILSVSGSYRVYARPVESPSHAGDPFADLRELVVNPADPVASPLGWHDTGATQYTVTRGNNVHAYNDIDADGLPDPGSDPDGGASLSFDFPVDFTADPLTYQPAAVTNLFYWNNVIHDVLYRYGFDEDAGNFQINNFGRGGVEGDDVRAEALDGSGTNNANFFTPVDGARPRMQMYRWTAPVVVTVNPPSPIAGAYEARGAGFGPQLSATGISGDVELANDAVGAANDACEPLVGFTPGRIALLDRGTCAFTIKVANAEAAGAIAAIVANNVPGPPVSMGGADPAITIPSAMISLDDGNLFKASLPLNATLQKDGEDRDSDFDNGVIVHEYAHGISNRLVGGPSTVSCLATLYTDGVTIFESEQMGEGWSDFYALLLTDTNTDDRGIGTYVSFQPTTGQGIRPFPYSTSFATNPATYDLIKNPGITAPHGVGFVWATMLWDMTRDLVARHGFNPDIREDWSTGGNNLSLQLVTEGLKMTVCRPGFVDGRDAILAADALITGAANQCLIWDAFARRGLGFSADQGGYWDRLDGSEAFDLPVSCSTVAMVEDQVEALYASGVLNKGQANSLLSKLANAGRMLDRGQAGPALNMIGAFLNEVAALVRSRRLTQEQADVLIEHAEGLIARIHEFYPEAARDALASLDAEAADKANGTAIPEHYALDQNYPNPFRGSTEIRFALPEAAHVRLVVYDLMGREVARLADGEFEAGFHEAAFDASRLASGTYLYRIEAGTFTAVQRMVLVR